MKKMFSQTSTNDRYFIGGIISYLLLLLFWAYLIQFAKGNLVSNVCGTTWHYYVLMSLFIINVYFAVKDKKCYLLLVITLFMYFSWFSFADNYYSPCDEIMNFENINHIVANGSLATFDDDLDYVFLNEATNSVSSIGNGINYEAVQAPLYYLILAGVGTFIGNAYLRLHVFRLLCLFSVLLIYFFVEKAILALEKNGIEIDKELFRLSTLITFLNAGFLYRASRLNNEILVCVLCAALLYVSVLCILNGYKIKYYWIIAFICGAMFLTKSTAIYAYVVIAIVAILQKKIIKAIIPVVVSTIPTIPWFVFNYSAYGHLTAMQEHLDFVLPIVNVSKRPQNIFEGFFNVLPGTYFTGEEVSLSGGELVWTNAIFLILLCLIVAVLLEVLHIVKKEKLSFEKYSKKTCINIICVSLIAASICCLIMGTISTRIQSLRGRYIYGPSIALILIILINKNVISEKMRKYITGIIIVGLGIVMVRDLTTFTDRVFTNEKIYANDLKTFELADVTNDDWKHGFSVRENCLLVEITDANRQDNLNALIDHIVSSGNQTAVVTGVSFISDDDEREWAWIFTNNHIDTELVQDNILQVGKQDYLLNYNTGATDSLIDNVEQQELVQELIIRDDCYLVGCELPLATYQESDYSAIVNYKILDENGDILINSYTELENIKDNSYARIYFEMPVEVKKNQKISMCFEFDNKADLPLAIRASENDSYYRGRCFLDGREETDLDIGIKLLVNY